PTGRDRAGPWTAPARAAARHAAEAAGQRGLRVGAAEGGERAARLDPGSAQPLLGLRPDAGQPPHRERLEETGLRTRRDDCQPARLAVLARVLPADFRGREAERSIPARLRPPRRAPRPPPAPCARESRRGPPPT